MKLKYKVMVIIGHIGEEDTYEVQVLVRGVTEEILYLSPAEYQKFLEEVGESHVIHEK